MESPKNDKKNKTETTGVTKGDLLKINESFGDTSCDLRVK